MVKQSSKLPGSLPLWISSCKEEALCLPWGPSSVSGCEWFRIRVCQKIKYPGEDFHSGNRDSKVYVPQIGWVSICLTMEKYVFSIYFLWFCSGLGRGIPPHFITSLPTAPHKMWRVVPMPWIIHSAALFGFGLGCFSNSSWGWFDVALFKVIQHPALLWLHWVQKLAGALCCIGAFTTAAKPINLFQRCDVEDYWTFYFYGSVFAWFLTWILGFILCHFLTLDTE